MLYNYTWLIADDTPASSYPMIYVSKVGDMNVNQVHASPTTSLYFPTAVAEYKPNGTVVATGYNVTRLIPHALERLLFVTDTGNHRVVIFNATDFGQFAYIGQFGTTGVPHAADNMTANIWKTGLNWPWGIAVKVPAVEARYEPTYANVFVVDRRNHRLVKLNLGYPLLPCVNGASDQTGPLLWDDQENTWMCRRFDKPRLSWGTSYGRGVTELGRPNGLTDPAAVGLYRHYIVVSEVRGNAITVLTLNHQPPYNLLLVTYFRPVRGIFLQGGMAVSDWGYIWYNYIGQDQKFYVSSIIIPEPLRESVEPDRLTDFEQTCVNQTWHDQLVKDVPAYIQYVGFALNATLINCIWPDLPNFTDIFSFNDSGTFNLTLFNQLVFNWTMISCAPTTTPTSPPFLSGDSSGWVINGQTQAEFTRRNGAPRMYHFQLVLVFCCTLVSQLFILYGP
jgi:hypothetical protein